MKENLKDKLNRYKNQGYLDGDVAEIAIERINNRLKKELEINKSKVDELKSNRQGLGLDNYFDKKHILQVLS